jgi:hypothetical protein
MKRDERSKQPRRCPDYARIEFSQRRDSMAMQREIVTNDWRRIKILIARYPELRRELPPSFNELRLVVDNSPKRPAGKVERYRSRQNGDDNGSDAA